MNVFIGGSKTVTQLTDGAKLAIDKLCAIGAHILIGDCFGADKLVQEYLVERRYSNVEVYVSGENTRNNIGDFPEKHIAANGLSGFLFYRQKDIAMAKDADTGLMLWDGKTRGTLCNIEELRATGKEVHVIMYKGE